MSAIVVGALPEGASEWEAVADVPTAPLDVLVVRPREVVGEQVRALKEKFRRPRPLVRKPATRR